MSAAAGLRLALAQPAIEAGLPERSKLDVALGMIGSAAERGADLLLFPESYPGPIGTGESFDAEAPIASACRSHGLAVCWGRVERGSDERFYTVAYLHDRHGERVGRYVRSHPATGDVHPVLSGVAMAPGEDLGLFELEGLKLGVAICSELWIPEVGRTLALRGAEILLAPAGGGFHRVASNWQLIARARAIENELHVGLTQQLIGEEQGSALIAGPEDLVASLGDAGLLVADIDLERARWLRGQDDSMLEPKPFSALPGLIRARRPALYPELTRPTEGLYDYDAAGG